jgi:hypothetical protein
VEEGEGEEGEGEGEDRKEAIKNLLCTLLSSSAMDVPSEVCFLKKCTKRIFSNSKFRNSHFLVEIHFFRFRKMCTWQNPRSCI